MFDSIKKILGIPVTDFSEVMKTGAIIVDVRSAQEYQSGHIKGSVNIPLDKLVHNFSKLKDKNKPIITCCASGMRSASAKSILQNNGYTEVYNGGGWNSLGHKLNNKR